MGWVSLNLRMQTCKQEKNRGELQDIQLSRAIRRIQRRLSFDQSIYNKAKTSELNEAKKEMLEVREGRPETSDQEAYMEWQQLYSDAKSDYEAQKNDINDYYDDILQELEEEATDEETAKQDEQTTLESQLEDISAEMESIKEQISADIQASQIQFK